MVKTPTPSRNQEIAFICYHLYKGTLNHDRISDDGLYSFQTLVANSVSSEELLRFAEKIRQSKKFEESYLPIADSLPSEIVTPLDISEKDSFTFIQRVIESFDHSIIFNQKVTAETTHIVQGNTADTTKEIHGNMPCWTLHLTTLGKALFINEHMELEVQPGDMMLFHPKAKYHYGLHPAAHEWEHMWALFLPRPHWTEWLDWKSVNEGILHLSIKDNSKLAKLKSLFQNLIDMRQTPSPYLSDLQYNNLEEILIRAKEYDSDHEHMQIDPRIQKACKYIQNHITKNIVVEDVAEACNLSTSRISHLFKQHMGVSLMSWHNDIRLQQARKLLLNSTANISKIAKEVGYDDPVQFTKNFKKNIGCSPRAFRQSFDSHHLQQ